LKLANVQLLATVQKIVTEILPPSSGLAFGKDARDLLIDCCVEFITLISSEANEISEKEAKKTIACEHITKALEQLGFGEYVADILDVASEHKEQLKVNFRNLPEERGCLLMAIRGERRRQISWSLAAYRPSSCWLCKKPPLKKLQSDTDRLVKFDNHCMKGRYMRIWLVWWVVKGTPHWLL
jgi:histone H3/H4